MLTRTQIEARDQATAGSPEDKSRYMMTLHLPHRNFDAVEREVRTCMVAGTGLAIILVVGPPGVGKTTFGRYRLRQLLRSYAVPIRENAGFIPAVMVDLDVAEKNREVNWALLYSRLCSALLAPSPLDGYTVERVDQEPYDVFRNGKLMLEAALKNRGLQHLILDEVVYLTKSSTDPFYYGELLKSLSNRSGFNLLLLGAYGSEELSVASGPLARRTIVIQYPRYKETDDDYREYCTFVAGLLPLLPYRFEVDIEKHVEYLFTACIGLPGLTVDVIKEACSRCDENRRADWDEKYLFKSMPSKEAHKKLLTDTLIGERNIEDYLRREAIQGYMSEKDVKTQLEVLRENLK
ncbi:ATP-binding protein [Paraburkholderia phenoliruptrix]|uniref:ATP-binding protein n=1 Tax=Paraburkholderia phenoliruptrix TaxID=252970 RepID=UPI002869CF4C|nr:ATP-binding protein [Paraburkholderia phenoliruptrix]WMY11751.1 ATP-binding protein [Paraburkholderia phenoliruptrix]